MVVDEAEQDRRVPVAVGGEHLARAVVEVGVPQPMRVGHLVAADLEFTRAALSRLAVGAIASPNAALAVQALGLHETAHRLIGRQHDAGARTVRSRHTRTKIIVVKFDRPAWMLVVLLAYQLAQLQR